nr:hypothetical protein [Diadegma semiclausum ichnovirus]
MTLLYTIVYKSMCIVCIRLEGILIPSWIRIAEQVQDLFSEPRSRGCGHAGCQCRSASPICLLLSFFGRSLGCLGLFLSSFFPFAAFGRMLLYSFFLQYLTPVLLNLLCL